MNDSLSALLDLQSLDVRFLELEAQVKAVPLEVVALERKIAGLKATAEAAQRAYQAQEVKRREVESKLAGLEESIVRYKTQQLSVKKNEEYTALEHQMAAVRQEMSHLEEEGISLLIALDEARLKLAEEAQLQAAQIAQLTAGLSELQVRQSELKLKAEAAHKAYKDASHQLPAELLERYESVKKRVKRAPFVVVLKDHRCQGCYLKLSQESEGAVLSTGIAPCDQCGRLMYRP